jgi:3-methyladenine DNA glycosylase/8-oxoguanine DNA glycosylase
MEQSFAVVAPINLAATLRTTGVGRQVNGHFVWSTVTPDGVGTVALKLDGAGVTAEAWGAGGSSLLERVPHLIGNCDTPWESVPHELRDLAATRRGLRLGSNRAMYETVATAVIGQVVTTKEAKASLSRLVWAYGEPGEGPFDSVRAFPAAERLSRLKPEDLHTFGIERRRAEILIEVARRAKRIDEALDMDPVGAERRLLAVRGVGPWTAGIAMGCAYGDADAVAVGDFHLPNIIAWALAAENRATDDRMLELLEPYRPHRRRVVQLIKQAGIKAPTYGPRTPVRGHL